MAEVSILVPGVGESISEGILARWLKPDGSAVKSGEPLFELETDKASNVVPASASGVLKIGVAEGTTTTKTRRADAAATARGAGARLCVGASLVVQASAHGTLARRGSATMTGRTTARRAGAGPLIIRCFPLSWMLGRPLCPSSMLGCSNSIVRSPVWP
jgi:pyruvate/2-oxoglutarate dehydrogenase complex dihydrolipoamide acyltransferase (E2) component